MASFSVIVQSPEVRDLVQQNLLQRKFHDALFPRMLFRGEAMPESVEGNIGDNFVFTAPGLVPPSQEPLKPGLDPEPTTYGAEQWESTIQQYADSIDTNMPTSANALANLLLRNGQQLGLGAAQSLNRNVRDRMYNAGLSGQTVAVGAATSTSLRVSRLNGFTKARNPSASLGSQVKFNPVSTNNPLGIFINFTGGFENLANATPDAYVIGYTPDKPGDEIGPGVLTLAANATWTDRQAVWSADCSNVIRAGGGNSVGSIGSTDIFDFDSVEAAVASLWQNNVPEHAATGRFHCHLSPGAISQIFQDPQFGRLNTALPDHYMYREMMLGEILNTIFMRNTECPLPSTVNQPVVAGAYTFSTKDPFAGELSSTGLTSGQTVSRALFTSEGALLEVYQDPELFISEAGVTGKTGEFSIENSGIKVFTDRIQLILRAPLDRLQQKVSMSWCFVGDWPVRTDAAVGGSARYKRYAVCEFAG